MEGLRVGCGCEVGHKIQQNKVHQVLVLQVVSLLLICRLPWTEEPRAVLCEKLFHLLLMLVKTRLS